MKCYAETQITPMPLKYFKNKHALDGLFGVRLVWYTQKAAKEYYKKTGLKCPELFWIVPDIKNLKGE
jgi:hypothetical protein